MTDNVLNSNEHSKIADKSKNAGVLHGAQESTSFSEVLSMAAALDAVEKSVSATEELRCTKCNLNFDNYNNLVEHYKNFHVGAVLPEMIILKLNGKNCKVLTESHWTLHHVLQYKLGLTGAKHMCNHGACGSCTVIMDGRPVLSCMLLAIECEGKNIWTVEGIASDAKWRPLIDAYCKWDAMQCGYCTTGFLVTAKALLDRNPQPTEAECKEALSGNICICGTYPRHATAILEAALKISKEE